MNMILKNIFFFQATDNSDEEEIPVPSASVGRDGGECDFSVGSFVVSMTTFGTLHKWKVNSLRINFQAAFC
jgi:hypothetical protein